ncbi:MAG: class I SAM-dependent methyltransferase [Calditrichaeota bacterium]|nr:class I SAM-dependent methyltransferase [Calditrichota bacterium]
MDNRQWSENILKKVDPSFRHRWIVYDEVVKNLLTKKTTWIDCGCGDNGSVAEFGFMAGKAVGIDILKPEEARAPFIVADVRRMPFPSQFADLITLRFVVEHFDQAESYLSEIERVLKPGGKVVILTTNLLCPFIFIPRLLLPYKLKHAVITKLFKVADEDIFPAYHKLNTPKKFETIARRVPDLKLIRLEYISDLNYTRRWMFLIFLSWHALTQRLNIKKLRSNILAVLEKK